MLRGYNHESFFDEMLERDGNIRPHYRRFCSLFETLGSEEFAEKRHSIDLAFLRQGITFNVYGDFSHCGADMKGGFLNYFFNTPEVHRWHHSTEYPNDPKFRYGCNYGVGVSFWDILFGTFYMPKDEKGCVIPPPAIGHPEGFPDEPNYIKILLGVRAFPWLERLMEAKKQPLPSSLPAE